MTAILRTLDGQIISLGAPSMPSMNSRAEIDRALERLEHLRSLLAGHMVAIERHVACIRDIERQANELTASLPRPPSEDRPT